MKHSFCPRPEPRSISLPFAFLLWAASANAAETASSAEPTPVKRERLVIETSLVTPMFGAYYLEANLRVGDAFSVLINGSRLTLDHNEWSTQTNSVGAGVAYYFQGKALREWYVEAQGELLVSYWKHDPSGVSASVGYGASSTLLVGYSFVSDLGPVLDLGVGAVGLRFPGAQVNTPDGPRVSKPFTQVYPALKVSIGWAF